MNNNLTENQINNLYKIYKQHNPNASEKQLISYLNVNCNMKDTYEEIKGQLIYLLNK